MRFQVSALLVQVISMVMTPVSAALLLSISIGILDFTWQYIRWEISENTELGRIKSVESNVVLVVMADVPELSVDQSGRRQLALFQRIVVDESQFASGIWYDVAEGAPAGNASHSAGRRPLSLDLYLADAHLLEISIAPSQRRTFSIDVVGPIQERI